MKRPSFIACNWRQQICDALTYLTCLAILWLLFIYEQEPKQLIEYTDCHALQVAYSCDEIGDECDLGAIKLCPTRTIYHTTTGTVGQLIFWQIPMALWNEIFPSSPITK